MTKTTDDDVLALWRQNLKKSLRTRGVTLGTASERAGKNAEYLSRVLSGKINPTMDTIVQICNNHDIAFSELFSGVMLEGDDDASFLGQTGLSEESTRIASKIIRPAQKE